MTTLLHDAPATSVAGAKVAIFTEGSPVELVPLHEFLDPEFNEFSAEELVEFLRSIGWNLPHQFGGGAGPLHVVKLYEPGDEHLTWREITCPDFDAHGDLRGAGCRSCGKVPA